MTKPFAVDRNYRYWTLLAAGSILLEAVALVYQHVLDEPPCLLCIHMRIGILLILLLALTGFFLHRWRVIRVLLHLSIAAVSAALLERAWELFGTERGLVIGSCEFDLGLPSWLALDQWLPSVFEVQTSCGYTPELLFGITMAESLLIIFALLLLLSLLLALGNIRTKSESP